jgi:hypothetical protein
MQTSYLISRWFYRVSAFGCCLIAQVACADPASMTRVFQQQPVLVGFDVCHSGGCADVSHVEITLEEWRQVKGVFEPMAEDAEDERNYIAKAIGVLETIVGAKTGTSGDKGGTFGNFVYPGQLDCNDEAINSTSYMKLMRQAGLIKFHQILDINRRGYFIHGWPHSTATILDSQTNVPYAVDSWFYDNGLPAVILPLEKWKSGWKPAGF